MTAGQSRLQVVETMEPLMRTECAGEVGKQNLKTWAEGFKSEGSRRDEDDGGDGSDNYGVVSYELQSDMQPSPALYAEQPVGGGDYVRRSEIAPSDALYAHDVQPGGGEGAYVRQADRLPDQSLYAQPNAQPNVQPP